MIGDFAWSPDGKHIALVGHYNEKDTYQLFLVDTVDDGYPAQLTELNASALPWSPDSKQIAFVSNWYASFNLWVVDIESNGLTELMHDQLASMGELDWSPDGN